MRHPFQQQNETKIKADILKMLRREFPQVWVYKSADKFTAGIPDLLCCAAGDFIGLEIKRPGKGADPIQQFCINAINKSGGYATVVRSVEEVRQIMKETLWP